MTCSSLLSAVVLLGGLGFGAAAQEQAGAATARQGSGSPNFRVGTNLVALNVTVTQGPRLISGLSRDQFVVYEDGVPQDVQFFEVSAVPLDLVLLLDTSSSMRPVMPTVHRAAIEFMKVLRPGDRGAVVGFNERMRVMQDLTADTEALAAAIDATEANGSTALNTALYVSLKAFGRGAISSGEVRRQAFAVLSDGEDTVSTVPFEQVIELSRQMGVSIYTISLQAPSRKPKPSGASIYDSPAAYALNQLARETGAQAYFPSGVHELKSVYHSIAAELAAQYSIGYLPVDDRADGRFRQVQVSIPGNPQLRSRTRAGYTVDETRRGHGF